MTYDNLKAEFRLTNDGDSWGNAMSWWFAVAGEMYERGLEVPPAWQYRPSPMGAIDPDQYEAPIVAEAADDNLCRFGAMLHRYAGMLRAAGKDY